MLSNGLLQEIIDSKQITVSYKDHMGSDLSVVDAARVSFDRESQGMCEADERLIKYLAGHNPQHKTPFRHNAIQVRCQAPIFLAAQLKKHQAGFSWNEVSRRYVSSEPEFYHPPTWRKKPEKNIKQGSGEAHPDTKLIQYMAKALYDKIISQYDVLLNDGVAAELARAILPQAMMTQWIWTGNLLSFSHVYLERKESSAQLEAQAFAYELDQVIRPLFPRAWAALVD